MLKLKKLLLLTLLIPLGDLFAEQDLYLRIEPGAVIPVQS
jgi:hypothetical protein